MARLTFALFGALACLSHESAADPPATAPRSFERAAPKPVNSQGLDGTWVREVVMADAGAVQTIFTFKGDRLTAKFVECEYVEGVEKLKSGSFEFECSCHRTADGYVVGRVIGVELDLKNLPLEGGISAEIFKGLNKVYGEPFCFRCDVRDGVMTVADLRLPMPEGMTHSTNAVRDMATAFAGGKYKKSETASVPLPKVERPKNANAFKPFAPDPNLPMSVRATPGPLPVRPSTAFPTPPTLLPTAGMLLPPGSMKDAPMLPMVKDAWKESTAPRPSK